MKHRLLPAGEYVESLFHAREHAEPRTGEQDAMRAQFFSGLRHYIPIRLAAILLTYLIQVMLGYWVGARDFGIYSMATTVAFTLGYLVTMGFPTSMERYIPVYVEEGNWGLVKGLVRVGVTLTVISSLVIGGITLVYHYYSDRGTDAVTFALAMSMVPFIGVGEILAGYFHGCKRWLATFLPDSLLAPALFLVFLYLVHVYLEPVHCGKVVGAMVLATCLAVLTQYVLFVTTVPPEYREATACVDHREWLGTSLPVMLLTGLVIVMNRADLLIVGWIKGAHYAGIYAATLATSELLNIFYKASNSVCLPSMAPLFKKGRLADLQALITLSIRCAFIPTVLLALPLAFFGTHVLKAFGPAFTEGEHALYLLILLQILTSLTGAPGFLLIMVGKQSATIKIMVTTMALHVVLLVLLTSKFGIVGAAVASLISSYGSKVLVNTTATRLTGVNLSVFSRPAPSASPGS